MTQSTDAINFQNNHNQTITVKWENSIETPTFGALSEGVATNG